MKLLKMLSLVLNTLWNDSSNHTSNPPAKLWNQPINPFFTHIPRTSPKEVSGKLCNYGVRAKVILVVFVYCLIYMFQLSVLPGLKWSYCWLFTCFCLLIINTISHLADHYWTHSCFTFKLIIKITHCFTGSSLATLWSCSIPWSISYVRQGRSCETIQS